jgi:hypothetical protein
MNTSTRSTITTSNSIPSPLNNFSIKNNSFEEVKYYFHEDTTIRTRALFYAIIYGVIGIMLVLKPVSPKA